MSDVPSNGWRTSYKVAFAVATLLPLAAAIGIAVAKVQAVGQLPAQVAALKAAHDTQTTILREQLRLQRCLVIYAREGCVALAKEGDP